MKPARTRLIAIGCGLVLTGGGAALISSSVQPSAFATDGPTPPTPATDEERNAVLMLLDELHLDVERLAALNVTGEQAASIYAAARTWRSQHGTGLAVLRSNCAGLAHDHRAARLAVRSGLADPSLLTTARSASATGIAAYREQLASLRSTIGAQLSESQLAAWEHMRTNGGQSVPLSLLALTSEQTAGLQESEDVLRAAVAGALSDSARQAAYAAHQERVASLLPSGASTIIAAFESTASTSLANVISARDSVLHVVPAETEG